MSRAALRTPVKPKTNRESVDCVVVAGHDEAVAHGPGAVYFVENDDGPYVGMVLPGEQFPREIPVFPPYGWAWDGNREKPTITPSIRTSITWGEEREEIELWHGYLTAGRLVSC